MRRLLFLLLVFAIELTVLSLAVDGQSLLQGVGSAARLLGGWGMPVLHFLVSLTALAATFTWLKKRPAIEAFGRQAELSSARLPVAILHVFTFAGLMFAGHILYAPAAVHGGPLVAIFLALGVGVLITGLAAAQPLVEWWRLARSIGIIWGWAAFSALAAVWMTASWRSLWQPASGATYWLVQALLRPFIGHLIIEPEKMRIATGRFGVIISPECSGLEGIGLLLLFTAVWLWLDREECRFPQALLLIPVGVITLFLLNSVRIAALILIGDAGAREVAAEGFHSQAGWIAFNGVAFGLCAVAGRLPWFSGKSAKLPAARNPVAVYLGPLLAMLAAGMLSRSLTGGFEWTYGLRVLATALVFWSYRKEYAQIDWRITWRGPAAGVLVFALWMALERALHGWTTSPEPGALQAASPAVQWVWIFMRLAGGVVLVPFAEELAFRGYLLRRLVSEEFEGLSPGRSTLWAVIASSMAFGAMHGTRWLAGTLAGVVFALVYRKFGRLGDAVAAHAVTNALIAVTVLNFNGWSLW